MGRPSVKAERTEEILDAFERCVARYGVEGTSLERIAEESGLRRSLLRYYIGNRDELVEALADRFITKGERLMQETIALLPNENKVEALLEIFFADYEPDDSMALVAASLIASSSSYPKVQRKLRDWYDEFVLKISRVIQSDYPDADAERCWTIAVGVVGIYFNADSMEPLGLSGLYRKASIETCRLLLATLPRSA
ncbi:MAG: TetR/AcrR family transcriptional regulator [Pseudomonadota bacterium]|nr:TetR/AcrR family transcriptional regulator [Pseudomonadota bacterium]